MKRMTRVVLFIGLSLMVLSGMLQPVCAQEHVVLDFYYSSSCGKCNIKKELINKSFVQNESYQDILVVWKDIAKNTTYLNEWKTDYKNYSYPFVVIRSSTNETVVREQQIEAQYIAGIIEAYRAGLTINETTDDHSIIIETIFGTLSINLSSISLPILTIILGGLDSFNPCAFFILIFLLNLLIYARSRKRMMVIGGVFIFFSGLLYFLFMFLLFNAFFLTRDHVGIITLVAGGLALILGIINIKDFFWFKKGASLSIPDDKKPGLFKQMRKLVKTPQLAFAIAGTIVLAGTVNFYELLCTLGLPLVFTQKLALYNLSTAEYYLYIFFYNVVYVIPLIIIVLIFVITLGKRKLSEWHGQMLKLMTGIMLSSFGVLFLVNYQLLENVLTPILLLIGSVLATLAISQLWKRVHTDKHVENTKNK